MPRTSNKAEKIVEFVNAFVAENGYSPSVREIGEAVGLRSTASVSYHLQALQEKGVFQQPPVKGRKRALVSGSRQGQIPVIGMVTAGLPILAIENQEGTIPWEDPSCFALRVRGDSMVGAGKRLRRRNGEIWLMPENDNYDPIDGTEAQILGLVKGVVREY